MLELKTNKNIKMVHLVFGERYCNQRCQYCAYPKEPAVTLTPSEKINAQDNIRNLSQLVKKYFKGVKMLSVTGGEPFLYPKIVSLLCQEFGNLTIRLSTNGILIDKKILGNLDPKNLIMAISLDGHTTAMNKLRSEETVTTKIIMENIKTILEMGIEVEILTTLHRVNIDGFFDFLEKLEIQYQKYIETGKLKLLASPVVSYNHDNFAIKTLQKGRFLLRYKQKKDRLLLLKNQVRYYLELAKFLEDTKKTRCAMPKWALSVKYLGDSLWTDGRFLLYGCGCRGIKVLGQMDLKLKYEAESLIERVNSKILNNFFIKEPAICRDCFNNWHEYNFYWKDNSIKNTKGEQK